MVAFMDHQAPIDLGQLRIDLARGISGEEQRFLDAIIAGLGQLLPWALDATGCASCRVARTFN